MPTNGCVSHSTEQLVSRMRLTWAPLLACYPEETELLALFSDCLQECMFPCIHAILRPLLQLTVRTCARSSRVFARTIF